MNCCALQLGSLHELHEDDAPQASNLVDIAPFLWAAPHNLGGFQSTVIQQVGQSTLTFAGEPRLEPAPDFAAVRMAFQVSLVCHALADRSGTRGDPQCLQDGSV